MCCTFSRDINQKLITMAQDQKKQNEKQDKKSEKSTQKTERQQTKK
jgi:hypothetical protein